MKSKLQQLLLSLGIHRTRLGYRYLSDCLKLIIEDEDNMLCYNSLFRKVGKYYGTSADNVSHCIHTAIDKSWNNGNQKLLKEIAGYTLDCMPTNGEFIEILYRHLEKGSVNKVR